MDGQMGKVIKYFMIIVTVVAFLGVDVLLHTYLGEIVSETLPSYIPYLDALSRGFDILIGILASYLVYKILFSIFVPYEFSRHGRRSSELVKLTLRILFFMAIISIILSASGVSLSGVLAGGAIGGIIIGLAVQTVTTNLLSGVLLASSKTLLPGDLLVLKLFGTETLCEVHKVTTIFTEFKTQNDQLLKIPNTLLLGSAVFTLIGKERPYSYAYPVTVETHVPYEKMENVIKLRLRKEFKKLGLPVPEAYFTAKAGGAETFTVKILFNRISEVNPAVDAVNRAFDAGFFDSKK
jgi:small-conductance mechanosensitive channel